MTHALLKLTTLGALLALAGASHAADLTLSGQFSVHKDQAVIDFSLGTGGPVRLWTDSWQSGLNFDPLLTLFSASGVLMSSFDDNDGSVDASAGYFDAGQAFGFLQPGHYRLVLTASSNDALGLSLADGFTYDADAPIALVDWNQPGYDINANDQKGGFWRVQLSGVDQAAVVPEPASVALLIAGLAGLGGWLRRRT